MLIFKKIRIKYLWRKFVKLGYSTRSSNKDGLKVWQDKSKNLSSSVEFAWSDLANKLHDEVLGLGFDPEEFNQSSQHKEWEEVHFVDQLGSIPRRKEASLLSLMQIAYNFGSALYVARNSKVYQEERLKNLGFYKLNEPFKFIEL